MAAIQSLTSGERAASSAHDQKRTSSMFCICPFRSEEPFEFGHENGFELVVDGENNVVATSVSHEADKDRPGILNRTKLFSK
jgi:hypothetical protein